MVMGYGLVMGMVGGVGLVMVHTVSGGGLVGLGGRNVECVADGSNAAAAANGGNMRTMLWWVVVVGGVGKCMRRTATATAALQQCSQDGLWVVSTMRTVDDGMSVSGRR